MANVIVFHSVLGVRRGILDFSEELARHGNQVHVVDLYDGKSFDDMQEAFDHFLSIGIEGMMERTVQYTQDLPRDAVYAGFSNGGASAMLLAGTKPGAKGCLLMHAAMPIKELGMETWPADVPVQVHYAETDPWKEEDGITQLKNDVEGSDAPYAYYEYPVEGHLFTDAGLPEYHEASANMLLDRVKRFLQRVDDTAVK